MVSLDWRVDSRDGVALVELIVTNPTDIARRVRIADRLDGAVWPPRREGVPEAGWDDGGFEGVVAPGGRRALGYASPAPAGDSLAADSTADPPAEIVWTERAGETERSGASDRVGSSERAAPTERRDHAAAAADVSGVESPPTIESTPEGVVRALGDARPPADAVPRPEVGDGDAESSAANEPASRRSP